MAFGREARIWTLLIIDTMFFFVELITGYVVGSLALVSDSYHMLNDIVSLVIALYAVRLAAKDYSEHNGRITKSSENSYGWQRAEILGALINGVFLLALCFSIFMEAIERFFNITEVSNPKLVIIVGSFGLASNILGLFLFHEHGHSHGGHSHSHSPPTDEESTPALSTSHSHHLSTSPTPVPDATRPSHTRQDSLGSMFGHPAQTRAALIEQAHEFGYGKKDREMAFSPEAGLSSSPGGHERSQSRNRSIGGRSGAGQRHSMGGNEVIGGSNLRSVVESESAFAEDGNHPGHTHSHEATVPSPNGVGGGHEGHDHGNGNGKALDSKVKDHDHDDHDHDHGHSHGGGGGGGHGGHSHGNMNMRGVFLHVLGDALGNVGVIAAGLVIMLAEGRWRYYFDPAISLLITCIIFSSALPLVKSASFILLQGVPSNISLQAVRDSIYKVDGVLSLHELHIWQLSEKTVVASVHVLVARDKDYMEVANGIRHALHDHGVHSSTIQPEFAEEGEDVVEGETTACLIRCPPDSCEGDTCCPPITGKLVDVDGNEDVVNGPKNGSV